MTKYVKYYDILIEKAKNRNIEDYTEKHHIIPRCMGGSNDNYNLIALTPEEHYLAHQLLVKIYPDNYKLLNAAIAMTKTATFTNRTKNKCYGWLKRKLYDHRIEKECKYCGKTYGKEHSPSYVKGKLFCSRKCAFEYRKPSLIIKNCKHCNKEFKVSPTDKWNQKILFCNNDCYKAFRAKHHSKMMKCIACDKEVKVEKWKQHLFKFCCRKCKDTYNRKKK